MPEVLAGRVLILQVSVVVEILVLNHLIRVELLIDSFIDYI